MSASRGRPAGYERAWVNYGTQFNCAQSVCPVSWFTIHPLGLVLVGCFIGNWATTDPGSEDRSTMPKHARGRHRPVRRRRLRLLVPLIAMVLAGGPAVTVVGDAPVPPGGARVEAGAGGGGTGMGRRVPTAPTGPVRPAAPACTVGPKLVPTCHVLWGAAAGGFGPVPGTRRCAPGRRPPAGRPRSTTRTTAATRRSPRRPRSRWPTMPGVPGF